MTSFAPSLFSAPSVISSLVMEYASKKKEKPYLVEDRVYDVFAQIVIKQMVSSVIFLDIDGVLFNNRMDGSIQKMAEKLFPNLQSYKSYDRTQCDIAATHLFDKQAMANLKKIIYNRDVAIVLSSNWKDYEAVPKIKAKFAACFFADYILDKTADSLDDEWVERRELLTGFSGRGAEIKDWLKRHPHITHYVIIDDYDNGISAHFSRRFVETNSSKLLTEANAKKAIEILDNDV